MFGSDTFLFKSYVEGKKKVIFPWSLSIVDCFFLSKAFLALTKPSDSINLKRLSDGGQQIGNAALRDAYDLYSIDSDADGSEVVLAHESGASCYWDLHERFVVATGPEEFLLLARPYPVDIERHRYIESMLYMEKDRNSEKPESVYDFLAAA
jgi:hypothetical protein